MPNIKRMSSQYENQDLLKNQPFYNEKQNKQKKIRKSTSKLKRDILKNEEINELNTRF